MADPTNPNQVGALGALADSLAALVEQSAALHTDVGAAEKARTKANRINTGVLAVLAAFTALLLVVAFQNNRIAGQAQQTNRQVADCTTAGGTCYEQGTKRTAAAIADLVLASVYVAECSRLHPGESGPVFDTAVEECVAARLSAAKPLPAPTVSPSLPSPRPSSSG
jgi:hypothetical protein